MLPVENRVVMLSGASGGVGRGILYCLLANGWRVSAGLRDIGGLDDLEARPDQLLCVPYDAALPDAGQQWVAATIARFGAIDAVINVAGVLLPSRLEDEDETALDQSWAINFKAPLRVVRAAFPALRRAGHGRVINVSSLSGKRVANTNIAYAASKFAVTAMTHVIRREGWDDGIRATAICPGFVNTPMVAGHVAVAPEDMTQPEDLAALTELTLRMPNTAIVAEILVNCRLEASL
ncbi:SDR family NAD(P)-dependent oxidoreductase [Acetobacter fallax]|uniref:SDR family NAD(P)-dependent oxidoreductase n=1 Tax=Acetobacter fallax TaxID=1737473 RepID=A0ABX0KBM9_9PROT|nr:SDR family NAD(P)-dependent oxidoreductase [Acetobacter fallax]NHO33805.1 SDR family NAD(P)-dependent oxidoreductase [Acetobacter fallax]NHO37366.1 SDR family NAD(P)-dependent oxidoreductase [Acetobacter fallax]